jgi:hypothetical protein
MEVKEMQTINNPKRKRIIFRIILAVLILIIAITVSAVLFLPTYVSSKKGNQFILGQINKRIDGKVNFESLSMSWKKGIEISGLSFHDTAGNVSANIKKIQTQPHYLSLLSDVPNIGETTVDQPTIEMKITKQAEKISPQAAEKPSGHKITLPQTDLSINDGDFKVTDQGGKTTELSQINSKLNLKPAGQQTNFNVGLNLSNNNKKSKVTAKGEVTPQKKTGWSLEGTSGSLTIEVNDLDIESLGPFFALAGINVQAKGNASAKAYAEIKDGRVEKVNGSIKGHKLDVTGPVIKGDNLHTNNLDINVRLARQQEMINIENFVIDSDWLKAQVTGAAPTTFESLNKFLNSASDLQANFDCQIGTVLSQMPHTIGTRKGLEINSGTLKGNVKTSTQAGKRNISGQASLAGLAGKVDGKNVALSEPVMITAQVGADDKAIRLDKLDISASFAQLDCSGTDKEVKYTFNTDLSKLQAEIGQFIDFGEYRIAGNYSELGMVTIDKDKIGIAGSAEVKELGITSGNTTAREPKADINFQMEYRGKEGILAIKSLNTIAALGKINVTDSIIAINKDAKQSQINASAQAVDLEKVQPFAVIFANLPEEMKIAGLAQSDILITKKNDDYEFKTNNTKINKLKISYPGQKDFTQEEMALVADCKYNTSDKTFTINAQLTSQQINIKSQAENKITGNTGNLKGQADLEYDWASISTLAAPYLPAGLKIEGKRKETIVFSSQYPADKPEEMFANLNAKGSVGFDRAQYSGLDAGSTQVNIAADKWILNIAPFSSPLNGGQLNFAASVDLHSRPAKMTMPANSQIVIKDAQLNDIISNKILPYINPIFRDAINVSGTATLSFESLSVPFSGNNLNDIDAAGTFSVKNLRIQTSDFLGQILAVMGKSTTSKEITISPVKFVLKNGKVKYDNMQIDIGGFSVNFLNATIGLDKSYDITIELPINGKRTRIPLKCKAGQKPQIDVEQLLKDQGVNLLENLLQKAIQKDKK